MKPYVYTFQDKHKKHQNHRCNALKPRRNT